ncbi:Hsp33 family molecular chaperone HslO [Wenzhouxiangella sp. AB-CW3]|uniref:Hsp33 family molecular chaperone HslO n=1 Tax=Wenzhouxiangella sp. AB-CW3 TaxID=2771012 RepID=UPI00168ABE7A|nr:Hsp33 family molecular chaperone HslO [Wenzhouxiangella sp. AB-CW3]QOC21128.1 Hsp33 family molecular chaperone HslO [Wenzhouxiangella sp. AB-CW3]
MMREDYLQRLVFEDIHARCVWVQLDAASQQVLARGDYPPAVADQLARALLMAAILSSGIKFEGRVSMQLQSRGELSLLLADCDESGGIRGIARIEEGAELPADARDLFRSLAADGTLALTVEPTRHGQRWQGIVPLEGDTLEQALEAYFRRSEQLPTRLRLAFDGQRCSALMLQKMPGEDEDADGWNRLQHLVETLSEEEMLNSDGAQVLRRLFHAETRRAFPARPLRFHCPCTRDRVASVLCSLGVDELRGLAAAQDHVDVRCEFCNESYRFDQVDLAGLIQGQEPDDSPTVH